MTIHLSLRSIFLVVGAAILIATGFGAAYAIFELGEDDGGSVESAIRDESSPTATRRVLITPKPTLSLPPNTEIEFTLNLGLGECQLGRPFPCNRTSTGAVPFEARVENTSRCAIRDVEVEVQLKDGNGAVVETLTEQITSLSVRIEPRGRQGADFVAPPPEELGWELYDSNVTWQWAC